MILEILYTTGFAFILICGLAYVVLAIFLNRGVFLLRPVKKNIQEKPPITFISVVVPARNEENFIARCLEDLVNQDYPKRLFEIIVADDNSADDTAAVVKSFIRSHPGISIRLTHPDPSVKGAHKKRALETAIGIARGDLIITTDADCRMGNHFLLSVAACFDTQHPRMILGPVTFFEGKSAFSQMQTLEFLSLIASGAAMAQLGKPIMANGANLAFTREAFYEAGGYAEHSNFASGDDVFLLHNFRRKFGDAGITFLYDREALVRTYPQPSLKGFLNQRIRWASKAKGYRDRTALVISVIVLLFCLSLIAGLITACFLWPFALLAAGLWLIKCTVDLPLLMRITDFTRQRRLLKYYFLLQLIYPFYIVLVALVGLSGRYEWKGRRSLH